MGFGGGGVVNLEAARFQAQGDSAGFLPIPDVPGMGWLGHLVGSSWAVSLCSEASVERSSGSSSGAPWCVLLPAYFCQKGTIRPF